MAPGRAANGATRPAGHAAAALGTPATTFDRWLTGGGLTRLSIALLAIYFGVDQVALRGLSGKHAGKVAAGKARVERLGLHYKRALAATARAAATSAREPRPCHPRLALDDGPTPTPG